MRTRQKKIYIYNAFVGGKKRPINSTAQSKFGLRAAAATKTEDKNWDKCNCKAKRTQASQRNNPK